MKNLIETIRKRIQAWHEQHAARMEKERQARLDAEARTAVQVMEYNGILYVSVNGTPLFGAADLAQDLTKSVSQARQVYKGWKEEKLWEER